MSDFNLPADRPPTEDEMNAIKTLFGRAADAIVNASALKRQLDSMESNMTALRAEVDSLNNYNRHLIADLSAAKQQNDELQAKINAQFEEVSRSRQQMAERDDSIKQLTDSNNSLNETVVRLRRESDDWQHKHNTLDAIQSTLRSRVQQVVDHVKEVDAVLNPPPPPPALPTIEWVEGANPVVHSGGDSGPQEAPVANPTSAGLVQSSEPTSSVQSGSDEERPWPAFGSGY